MSKRLRTKDNQQFGRITLRELVQAPQFRSGYRDRLANLPPKRFYYDPDAGKNADTWGYERGRLLATWLLAAGEQPPGVTNVEALIVFYQRAEDEGAML